MCIRDRNTDGSANALTFSLDPVAAAAGATITTINSTSGLFQWTPTVGGHYDNVQVIVTEAVTSLSATQAFSVDVLLTNNCAQLDQFLAAVQHLSLIHISQSIPATCSRSALRRGSYGNSTPAAGGSF